MIIMCSCRLGFNYYLSRAYCALGCRLGIKKSHNPLNSEQKKPPFFGVESDVRKESYFKIKGGRLSLDIIPCREKYFRVIFWRLKDTF